MEGLKTDDNITMYAFVAKRTQHYSICAMSKKKRASKTNLRVKGFKTDDKIKIYKHSWSREQIQHPYNYEETRIKNYFASERLQN